MRKELIWVILIGVTFGLVIAFGVWRVNSSLKSRDSVSTQIPTPKVKASEFKITLDKPQNNDVVTTDSITISGITKSLVWITISSENSDYIIQANENGIFQQDVDLIPGVNQIKLTALDSNGNESVEKVLIIYSSSFQEKNLPPPTNASGSAEATIREKVEEKVSQVTNRPKAYLGIVTDISDSTIQIKTTLGEINQIAIADENITAVNTKGTTNKVIKLNDVAIGDFVVAMGYINSNTVLAAQRILVIDPITEPKIQLVYGRVTEINKSIIKVDTINGEAGSTLNPDSKTNVMAYNNGKLTATKTASIGEGDTVISVSVTNSDSPSVRSVFIIQKAQS